MNADSQTRARVLPGDEERAWVQRAQQGQPRAFSRLYRAYGPMVHAVVLVRVRAEEVDDVVQEVFATAWQRLGELREPGAFGGWLLTIARRRAVDRRRQRRDTSPILVEPANRGPTPAQRAEAQAVLETIRGLPEAYQDTLVMRLVEGMTGPEISRRTGQTPGSVRVNLCRGMKLLRAALKGGRDEQ